MLFAATFKQAEDDTEQLLQIHRDEFGPHAYVFQQGLHGFESL